MALPRPRTAWPRLLSGGHVLRSVGELVASLVPALAAAPELAGGGRWARRKAAKIWQC